MNKFKVPCFTISFTLGSNTFDTSIVSLLVIRAFRDTLLPKFGKWINGIFVGLIWENGKDNCGEWVKNNTKEATHTSSELLDQDRRTDINLPVATAKSRIGMTALCEPAACFSWLFFISAHNNNKIKHNIMHCITRKLHKTSRQNAPWWTAW